LRISAVGKKEYRQKITVPSGQVNTIVAELVATPAAQPPKSPTDIVSGESVEALRIADAVRALQPLEDSKNINSLPGGVYGFTVPWLLNTKSSGVVGGTGVDRISLSRSSFGTFVTEIHKRETGQVLVVGYVTESDLAELQDPSRTSDVEITLFFRPYLEYSLAVAIPVSRIRASSSRSVERHYASDLSVRALPAKLRSKPMVQNTKR
jgi:hypothetical protein